MRARRALGKAPSSPNRTLNLEPSFASESRATIALRASLVVGPRNRSVKCHLSGATSFPGRLFGKIRAIAARASAVVGTPMKSRSVRAPSA